MILFVSLDAVMIVWAILCFLGIGWATMLGSWLWSHAIIVGILLLVIHIAISLVHIVCGMDDYSIIGLILAIIWSICSPAIIITFYKMMVASGKAFGVGFLLNWIMNFAVISVIDCLWYYAFETSGGRSYVRLLVFSIFAIAASVFVIRLALVEGF